MKKCFGLSIVALTVFVAGVANTATAATLFDGDFSAWSITTTSSPGNSASGSILTTGGNPGSNFVNDMFFPGGPSTFNWVFFIKDDYSTSANIAGQPWTLMVDYINLVGDPLPSYENAALAVQQGSSLFYHVPTFGALSGNGSWQTSSNSGNFNASDFLLIMGSDTLDFSGGVPTKFGLATYNLTFYSEISMAHDNFSLTSPVFPIVPEPSMAALAFAAARAPGRRTAAKEVNACGSV